MRSKTSVTISVGLILLGALMLAANIAGWLFGFRVWHLWPLIIVAVGCAFVLPPILGRGGRGLGALFVPGMPILATGVILLLDSVFRWWDVWTWFWPWEVISVALGLFFAAMYMKVPWLLIPAFIIGGNGLLFQFCAITGWWGVWSVLWIIEPVSLGMAFLYLSSQKSLPRLRTAGLILCAIAGLGFLESAFVTFVSLFMPVWWLWRWMWPMTLIMGGAALLLIGGRSSERRFAAE